MRTMRTGTKLEYRERIECAITFILGRIDNPPTPVEIADYAGFSRYHFGRVFSLAVGEPIAEFVRRIRLERAAWQLEFSDTSVTEIAFAAGYETLEGFSRAFREWFHVSPTEWRAAPARHEIQRACEVHWCPNGGRSNPVLVLNEASNMNATITNIDPITVVALRHIGPYHQIGPKFGQLRGWIGTHQIPMNMGIAIYYDNPDEVAAQEMRSDACMVVPADFELPSIDGLDIRKETIQGGEYATVTHMGSYEGIGDSWARFCGQAFPQLGRDFGDAPTFEIYMNDCSNTPVEELRTDLYLKVK